MTFEFVIVKYPRSRTVFVDEKRAGFTNTILVLEKGHHVFDLGKPVSYDAETGEWFPETPLGTCSMANCSCGNTMSISSDGMSYVTFIQLMLWGRVETWRRNISISDLLELVRREIDRSALA